MPKDDQKELFVVVDRNDNILNYKTRYECHHNKNLIHRAVGVIVFNKKGNILLQKRNVNKDLFPGFYTISTGGHVGKGESYEEAAKRELFEEIGIKTKLSYEKKFITETEAETEMNVVFSAYSDGPFNIDKDEIAEVAFFSHEEIKKMRKKLAPFAVKSLEKLKAL